MSREEFWLDNYKNLYNNSNYKKFIPQSNTPMVEKLNALTRLSIYSIILIIILILIFKRFHYLLYFPITFIVIIVIIYNISKKNKQKKQKKLDKIFNVKRVKDDIRKRNILEQYKHDGDIELENDLLSRGQSSLLRNLHPSAISPSDKYKSASHIKNYNVEAGYIDSNGDLRSGPKYNAYPHNNKQLPYSIQNMEQYRKDTCRRPTKDNPLMNPDITQYNAGDIPVACNADDEDINEESRVFFNHDLFQDVGDLWEKKNSQRQFYTLPNTGIPNRQVDFAKWLYYDQFGTCRENNQYCLRYEDLRRKR